ncbi:MAG: HPr kinase/phosphorylase [Leptospirales bacterium]|nr:HPr kinase/phosphorylase [Leptospirales bacterium]
MKQIAVAALLEHESGLDLQVVSGHAGLGRMVKSIDVNRPGLALAGFYKNFAYDRIQVFGRGEFAYIEECGNVKQKEIATTFFDFSMPGLVMTHGNQPPECFVRMSESSSIPILATTQSTHNFIMQFHHFMVEELAPSTSVHGVLVEVFGVGILLVGHSGIGKSETALELVERGHRLVADDAVNVRCVAGTDLYGQASELLQYHMEIRGLGIINVKDLFGVGAIRGRKRIELIAELEDWNPEKEYERLGLEDEMTEILGVPVPRITIPVRPGRNVPVLVETAAMNHRSKKMGYHAARVLSDRLREQMEKKKYTSGNAQG